MKPRVFVSRPAALTAEQDLRLRAWLVELELLSFESVELDRDSYGAVPWDQLRSAVGRADGALILGFRQLLVDDGVWRPETAESSVAARWWATPWNQIEAGLALMAGLPVLVAHEEGVNEGVFRADTRGGDLFGVSLDIDLEAAGTAVARWAKAVSDRASTVRATDT
jgi:hypothetical protein